MLFNVPFKLFTIHNTFFFVDFTCKMLGETILLCYYTATYLLLVVNLCLSFISFLTVFIMICSKGSVGFPFTWSSTKGKLQGINANRKTYGLIRQL